MARDPRAVHEVDHRSRDEDVRAAALHFVRTMTGTARPSDLDRPAYERAVATVAEATCCLLDELDAGACGHHAADARPGTQTARAAEHRQLRAV